jgi:hypothetical protein
MDNESALNIVTKLRADAVFKKLADELMHVLLNFRSKGEVAGNSAGSVLNLYQDRISKAIRVLVVGPIPDLARKFAEELLSEDSSRLAVDGFAMLSSQLRREAPEAQLDSLGRWDFPQEVVDKVGDAILNRSKFRLVCPMPWFSYMRNYVARTDAFVVFILPRLTVDSGPFLEVLRSHLSSQALTVEQGCDVYKSFLKYCISMLKDFSSKIGRCMAILGSKGDGDYVLFNTEQIVDVIEDLVDLDVAETDLLRILKPPPVE